MAGYQAKNDEIGEYVRETEEAFINGGGTLTSKYVTSDLYSDISKIYAYLESTHISGAKDSKRRDKPFFNISIGTRNIWYRATDIDRSHINVKATKTTDTLAAFAATVHLQDWMRREDFGTFLNKWGLDLAGFNSSVVKFIEEDGNLHAMVVPWSRIICDQVNFDANPKIELLELTEAELYMRKGYDKEIVEKLCAALTARETTDHQTKDTKSKYIKLYEVHGLFSEAVYKKAKGYEVQDGDDYKYSQQMFVLSFVASKDKGQFDDFILYCGKEEKDPYMLTSLIPSTDGSISLMGSVKSLFEAQWMLNHTVKSIKDQLDVASVLLLQTSDGNYLGRNVLAALTSGDILVHAVNQPLTQLNNTSHDITAQQSFGQMWKGLGSEIAGVSESMMGQTAPSGTAWRQVEALLAESHSLFELMTENKGLDVERMLRRFIIPFNKKKMDNADEISATLEAHNIAKIDAMYVPVAAARRFNEKVLNELEESIRNPDAPLPSPFNAQMEQEAVRQDMGALGNQRFFVPSDVDDRTWKEAFKDLEWEIEVDITGEQQNKQLILTTLNSALQAVVNPAFANNPQAQFLVNKALSLAGGVSPIEISTLPKPQVLPQMVGAGNSGGILPNNQPVQ